MTTTNEPSDKPARIMIVDDHAIVRHGLTLLISNEKDLDVCGEAADSDVAVVAAGPAVRLPEEELLSNKDYFWDWEED